MNIYNLYLYDERGRDIDIDIDKISGQAWIVASDGDNAARVSLSYEQVQRLVRFLTNPAESEQ